MALIDTLVRDVLNEFLILEREEVIPVIPSTTLQQAIRIKYDLDESFGFLFIPHYWAVYLHDGRGKVAPVTASKLVYFADPKDDPRIVGGYPVRMSDRVRLTYAEYRDGLRQNYLNKKAGLGPYMYVVDAVGPTRPEKSFPFFDVLADGAAERLTPTAFAMLDKAIQDLVRRDPDVRPQKKTVKLRLP